MADTNDYFIIALLALSETFEHKILVKRLQH